MGGKDNSDLLTVYCKRAVMSDWPAYRCTPILLECARGVGSKPV